MTLEVVIIRKTHANLEYERERERNSEREWGGEREREWVRVGSRRHYAGNGYGHQVERWKTNWRDASDIHSFFFTRFPEEMNESDLWYEFKKWGDVRETFIARNCNRWGKRYGFVRFKGVKDVTKFERKLDSLVVGGLKMHVNTPKHGRVRATLEEGIRGGREKKGQEEANGKGKHGYEDNHVDMKMKQFQQKKEATSYAKILMTEGRNTAPGRILKSPSLTGGVSHSSV